MLLMRLHGIARRLLPVLTMLLLLGASQHGLACERAPGEVAVSSAVDGGQHGDGVLSVGVHCAICHAAALPAPVSPAMAPLVALTLNGDSAVGPVAHPSDTPQRPPRRVAIA